MGLADWLENKVLICVGSGGVGKTTVSSSLAVLAARRGKKVLVMTIDPSRRLRVALGLGPGEKGIVRVPNQDYSGELFATWLDAAAIFQEFIESSSQDPELSHKLLKNRLYQQLSTTLSGSQEFTSLLQLTRMVDQSDFDLVILDTPPAQHAIDFLESPQKLHALFQESVVKWFLGQEQEMGFIRRVLAQGTLTVIGALQRVTGSDFMVELGDFFRSVKGVQVKIAQKTSQVRELLRRPSTRFILVTAFDQAKLHEAEQLQQYLKAEDYHLDGIVVNRAFPKWFQKNEEVHGSEVLLGAHRKWYSYFSDRNSLYKEFVKQWREEIKVLTLPDFSHEVAGLEALGGLSDELQQADETH